MTRGQIRTALRRRVQEVVSENWSDSYLNDLINIAYQRAELDVLSVNPQAFISTQRADIVSGQEFYRKPSGCNYEIAFKTLQDGVYKRIDMVDYVLGLARIESGEEGTKYSHYSDYYMLSPRPSTAVTAGIEVDFVPSLSMTDDSDVPLIPHPLHMAIVYHGQIIALGETGEEQKKAADELELLVGRIPTYYLQSSQPSVFRPDVVKGY